MRLPIILMALLAALFVAVMLGYFRWRENRRHDAQERCALRQSAASAAKSVGSVLVTAAALAPFLLIAIWGGEL